MVTTTTNETVVERMLRERKHRSTWIILLDTKANHEAAVATLCRNRDETYILEELRFQEMKMASSKTKLARFETFEAKWQAYASELGLIVCETTASFHDMHERLLAGSHL